LAKLTIWFGALLAAVSLGFWIGMGRVETAPCIRQELAFF